VGVSYNMMSKNSLRSSQHSHTGYTSSSNDTLGRVPMHERTVATLLDGVALAPLPCHRLSVAGQRAGGDSGTVVLSVVVQ
jgi:hypothetical protein